MCIADQYQIDDGSYQILRSNFLLHLWKTSLNFLLLPGRDDQRRAGEEVSALLNLFFKGVSIAYTCTSMVNGIYVWQPH